MPRACEALHAPAAPHRAVPPVLLWRHSSPHLYLLAPVHDCLVPFLHTTTQMKLITISALVERFKLGGSLAREIRQRRECAQKALREAQQGWLLHEDDIHLHRTNDALLGRGSFGEVYRAEYLGSEVAVKLIQYAADDATEAGGGGCSRGGGPCHRGPDPTSA